MDIVTRDPFWAEDPSILFHKDRVIEFLPVSDHTEEEFYNAFVRFSLYAGVLIFIFSRNYLLLGTLPFMVACCTFYCYYRTKEYTNPYDDELFPCTRPTTQNPVMNVMLDDIHANPPKKKACDVNHVGKKIDEILDKTVYKNSFDIMGDEFRNRHFYTMPNSTVPNDQTDFGEWLYKIPDTCKTNVDSCRVPEDIRQERDLVTTYMDQNKY